MSNENNIYYAHTDEEIKLCHPVMHVLHEHLSEAEFVKQVKLQQQSGYRLIFVKNDNVITAVAGYRLMDFLSCGKAMYIDDLITDESQRNKGYAGLLIDFLIQTAKDSGCNMIHLDTGYSRHTAHRLYLAKNFKIFCHHLALEL